MGSGAGYGFVRDAMNRASENRSALRKDNAYHKILSKNSGKTKYTFKQGSPETLEEIRRQMKADEKKRAKKRNLLLMVCTILFLLALWLVFTL